MSLRDSAGGDGGVNLCTDAHSARTGLGAEVTTGKETNQRRRTVRHTVVFDHKSGEVNTSLVEEQVANAGGRSNGSLFGRCIHYLRLPNVVTRNRFFLHHYGRTFEYDG